MLIKKLILKNFRQYIGEQEISFSTDKEKNVTVLIGMNTAGKTTFVRAFEWILYNKNEFDDKNLLNQNIVDKMQQGETRDVKRDKLSRVRSHELKERSQGINLRIRCVVSCEWWRYQTIGHSLILVRSSIGRQVNAKGASADGAMWNLLR